MRESEWSDPSLAFDPHPKDEGIFTMTAIDSSPVPPKQQTVIDVSPTREISCCCTPCVCTRIDGYELNNRAMDPSITSYTS